MADLPTGMGAALTNLGYVRSAMGDHDSAAVLFRRSVAFRQRLGDDYRAATGLEALAETLRRLGQLDAADSAASEAYTIEARILPAGHPTLSGPLLSRANIRSAQGRFEEAEALFDEVIALRVATWGSDHFTVAQVQNDRGRLFERAGRLADAEAAYRAGWQGYSRQFGHDHRNAAIVELNLARLLFQAGKHSEAETHLAHALPIARAAFPSDRRYLGDLVALALIRCQPATADTADRRDTDPYRAFALAVMAKLDAATP